jgi:hypothetical protein
VAARRFRGEALVADQQQPRSLGDQFGVDFEHHGQDLALAELGVGQRPQDRHPGQDILEIPISKTVE